MEYMKLFDLEGYIDRLRAEQKAERFNLFYWEGPGTTDYMVLNYASKEATLAFANRLNNFQSRWAVSTVKAVTL